MIALPGRLQPAAASLIRTLLLLTSFTLALAGCATVTPPAPQLPAPKWESAKLIEVMRQRQDQTRTLRALARVNYAGPEGKQSFDEAVLIQRPDRLRLETLSMLGAILIVTANQQEFIGYHPREGIMVRGQSSKANLMRYTQIPLELDEITALLAGLPPVDFSTPWQQDGNTLTFAPNGVKKDAVSFQSQQPVPTQWQRFNGSGAVELTAGFSDYVNTTAGLFPNTIIIEAPLQKKKVEIHFQQPELNAAIPAEQFSQTKPGHVQEVPIEAMGK